MLSIYKANIQLKLQSLIIGLVKIIENYFERKKKV